MRSHVITAALGVFVGAGVVSAQPSVLLAAAFGGSCQETDPQAKLLATGLFSTVDTFDVAAGTPTLNELLQYDAVMCWTNTTPNDWEAWGNVMADYVDAGGGVVVTVFANSSTTSQRRLGGRWDGDPAYEVIVTQSGNASGSGSLGTVHVPGHPIMSGVRTFATGVSGFRPSGTALHAGCELIAEWDDGRVLVAAGRNPKRADLGFYPPSGDCSAGWWDVSTDGDFLMANALLYVSESGCYADCDGGGTLDIFDFLCFQDAFTQLDPYADCDGSGTFDIFDFLCFQDAFAAGCP